MPIEGGISVALSSLRTIFALRPEARLRKDLSGIARVIEQYPEGSEARKTLLSTADAIARELYDRQSSRVRRVLQPASLLLGVIFAGLAAGSGYLVYRFASNWWVVTPTAAVGFAFFLCAVVGTAQGFGYMAPVSKNEDHAEPRPVGST